MLRERQWSTFYSVCMRVAAVMVNQSAADLIIKLYKAAMYSSATFPTNISVRDCFRVHGR